MMTAANPLGLGLVAIGLGHLVFLEGTCPDMSTTTTNPRVKFVGLLIMIAGAFMVVAGGVTWVLISSQLKAEHITVAAVTPRNPGSLAGKPVADPLTAYAQAAAIDHQALVAAGGRTYAQLGDDETALKAKLATDGLSKAEIAKNPDVVNLAVTRDSTLNVSLLRASLLTSVLSFGLAALVIGLGVVLWLIGFALRRLLTASVITSAHGEGGAVSSSKA
jgi:hypothetical protein